MALTEITYQETRFRLSYEMCNPSSWPTLLILHGWGSDKALMKQAFGRTLPDFQHLYLDLPGFGMSPNERVLTTAEYAQIVRLFLAKVKTEPMMILGHSFGGKVATLLQPKYLVLLASSGVLVPKPLIVRFKIGLSKRLKTFGFGGLRRWLASSDANQMSPAMYDTFKNVVDEPFEEHFRACPSQALLLWGRSDTATPLWTAQRILELISLSRLVSYEGDHYFFLQHSKVVSEEIRRWWQETCTEEEIIP
jgi:non-heme chloroperoxidase